MFLLLVNVARRGTPLNVGIVGGGPAGACFAARIREAFGSEASITVFEKKGHLGGQSQC